MVRSGGTLTAATLVWLVGLGVTGTPVLGREVKLAICPQKLPAEPGTYALLPPQASLTDGDAASLYEEAVKALPPDTDWNQIYDWLAMALEQLPLPEVQAVLEHQRETLDGVARAARCRQCDWPVLTTQAIMANLAEYRRLGFLVRLRARYEIARGNYEGALSTMQTGFGMSKHLTQAPTSIQFVVGVAIGGMMRTEVEEFVQGRDAPNLYAALIALPKPFADPEKAIENDRKASSPRLSGGETGNQVANEIKAMGDRMRATANERVRAMVKRLDSDLAALQCIEAIRAYAASHGGQLPQTLTEITEVVVPQDAASGAAFRYTRTGGTAVLESVVPAGDKPDILRYEIVVKK
jgi:hypothetical protein